MSKKKINVELFKKRGGISLDVGCGHAKQKGFVGMDIVGHDCVDIIQDIQEFPWPIPDSICYQVLLSHVWEHIEPKYRFSMMDECWRICRHDGQMLIAAPYANSFLAHAHPAHYMCPNEACFQFFDPDFPLYHACSYVKPSPWKIVTSDYNVQGTIEVVLSPRKDRKGFPHIPKVADGS